MAQKNSKSQKVMAYMLDFEAEKEWEEYRKSVSKHGAMSSKEVAKIKLAMGLTNKQDEEKAKPFPLDLFLAREEKNAREWKEALESSKKHGSISNKDSYFHAPGAPDIYSDSDDDDTSVEVNKMRRTVRKINTNKTPFHNPYDSWNPKPRKPVMKKSDGTREVNDKSTPLANQRKTNDLPRGVTTQMWDEYVKKPDEHRTFANLFSKVKEQTNGVTAKKQY